MTQLSGAFTLETQRWASVLDLPPSWSKGAPRSQLTEQHDGQVPWSVRISRLLAKRRSRRLDRSSRIPGDPDALLHGGTATTPPAPSSPSEVRLSVQDSTTLNIQGGLTINGQGGLSISSNPTLEISGSLLGNTTNVAGFDASGTVVFDSGNGTSKPPQLLEAMSQDLGNITTAFTQNFAYNTLKLTANTYVELVDNAANSPGNTPEAVYVNTLNVPAGATLNLNGLHLYANTENIKGTITGGVVSPTTVEWISSSSGNWNVASNWSTGAVPGSNQEVIIDVPGASPTVTINSGSQSVYSITANDPLSITGGSLTVAADSTIGGGLSMTGGSLSRTGRGPCSRSRGRRRFRGPASTQSQGRRSPCRNLQAYTGGSGYNTTLSATGSGSELDLPDLATWEGGYNGDGAEAQISSTSNGTVSMPALTTDTGGGTSIVRKGSGSVVSVLANQPHQRPSGQHLGAGDDAGWRGRHAGPDHPERRVADI